MKKTIVRTTDENGELVYVPPIPSLLESVFVHGGKLRGVFVGIQQVWVPHSWTQLDRLIMPAVPVTIHTVEPHRQVSIAIDERVS